MLKETYEQVLALIPRYSWEIMDEEQRDTLIAKVVLPRWMDKTRDGVDLGPKQWAKLLGATDEAVRGRVRRLKARSTASSSRSISEPTDSQKGAVRGARSVLKRHPELVNDLLNDPKVHELVSDAVLTSAGQTRKKAVVSDQRRELDVYDLFVKLQSASAELVKRLPDYLPSNEDVREEAENTALHADAVAEFLRQWIAGTDIADEVEAYLGSVAE